MPPFQDRGKSNYFGGLRYNTLDYSSDKLSGTVIYQIPKDKLICGDKGSLTTKMIEPFASFNTSILHKTKKALKWSEMQIREFSAMKAMRNVFKIEELVYEVRSKGKG